MLCFSLLFDVDELGVFGNVLKAEDSESDEQIVAIKMLRANDHMKRSGIDEAKVLELITGKDPDGSHNVVRLLSSFETHGHLCLVMEAMDMNLRQLLNKYGRNVGLGIDAVRIMGYKILKALVILKRCELIHADLKPDNILVDGSLTTVKVADLGSASRYLLPFILHFEFNLTTAFMRNGFLHRFWSLDIIGRLRLFSVFVMVTQSICFLSDVVCMSLRLVVCCYLLTILMTISDIFSSSPALSRSECSSKEFSRLSISMSRINSFCVKRRTKRPRR